MEGPVLQDLRHDFTTKTLHLTAKQSGIVRLTFEERFRMNARALDSEPALGVRKRKHGAERLERNDKGNLNNAPQSTGKD